MSQEFNVGQLDGSQAASHVSNPMVTVILPTANRPQMLRTALRSIDSQTAKEQIAKVIVSENGRNEASADVCKEFPSLPIHYVFRDSGMTAVDHGAQLYAEARTMAAPYVAVLHDDDWWGNDHIANGLDSLQRHPDAPAYWSSSFFVHGESSWFIGCWNMSCWAVTDFGPLNEIAKFTAKQAALACVAGAPASYSSLIAEKHALAEAFQEATMSANPLDNDRLLFLELALKGPILVNLVPEVFVRRHPTQDQWTFPERNTLHHTGASTRRVLSFCAEMGIDVIYEYERLYDKSGGYKSYLIDFFDPFVITELKRQKAFPYKLTPRKPRTAKWFMHQISPPLFWGMAKRMGKAALPALRRVL